MNGLVTGEAVALGLYPAKLPSRVLAIAIDVVVYWALYLVLSLVLLLATASLDDAAAAALAISSWLLLLVGVPIAVETLSHGRSLGKLACGLRVVRDDGGPIRFRHALVRGAVGVVESQATLGVVACVASLVSARGRRLGDVFAGTLVVRERVPVARGWAQAPPAPPWLVGEVSGLDLSAVPEGLWLALRQYLSRMGQLDPAVSASMAERLAADLAARVGTAVPPGAPPAAFLAAVAAERHARESRRVFGAPPGQGWGVVPGDAPGGRFAPGGPAAGAPRAAVGTVPGWAVPGSVAGDGAVAGAGGPVARSWDAAGDPTAGSPDEPGRGAGGGAADGPRGGQATGFSPPG